MVDRVRIDPILQVKKPRLRKLICLKSHTGWCGARIQRLPAPKFVLLYFYVRILIGGLPPNPLMVLILIGTEANKAF